MRSLIVFGILLVIFAGCMTAATPEIEMAEDLPTPTFHSVGPDGQAWNWNATHPEFVEDGPVTKKFECLLCHDPHDSCDKCHQYVGAMILFGEGKGGESHE